MAYTSLNFKNLIMRENSTSKRIRKEKLAAGIRYEYHRGMYGNVYQITDHKRKVFYRQDRKIREQLDLFDERLPRWCDYCNQQCEAITLVEYELVYEMTVRPLTHPEVKRDSVKVSFAACPLCGRTENKNIPKAFLQGYLVELYEDGKLAWIS